MDLISNIFNIAKVQNGVDANFMRIEPNVEQIYKFEKTKNTTIINSNGTTSNLDDGDESDNKGYTFSPDSLILSVLDTTTRDIQVIYNATVVTYLNRKKLEDLIGHWYSDFVNRRPTSTSNEDTTHWYFHIQSFYTALSSLTDVSGDNLDFLYNFFEDKDAQIDFDIIYNGSVLYRNIPVKVGIADEAAKLLVEADGIYAAIAEGGLKFDSNGLQIQNGNFSITNSNGKQVLSYDKNGELKIVGSGTFTGDISAATGTFTGSISATTGYIGGFIVGENSIESTDNGLQLFSQENLSIDFGEIIQGVILTANPGGQWQNTSYRVCTKNYIPVLPGKKYIIKTNIAYIVVAQYRSQDVDGYISSTAWNAVGSGYELNSSNSTNYIKIILAKSTTPRGEGVVKIVPEDVTSLTIEGTESLINVRNIHIGDGGFIDGSLKVGNLSILNPNKSSEDSTILKLEVPGEEKPYFKLTNEGYIEGANWSIKKEVGNDYVVARFGKLVSEDGEFNGTIHATNGVFSGEILSSVINASTINTANFVTEKTRSLGGSFIFKPTFEIKDIKDNGNNNVVFELDEDATDYFSGIGEINLDQTSFEQGGLNGTTGAPISTNNRIRTDFIEVNENEKFSRTVILAQDSTATVGVGAYTYGKDKSFISSETLQGLVIPEGVKYIRILIRYTNPEDSEIHPDDIKSFILKSENDKIVAVSGFSVNFGKIASINENNITVNFKNSDYNLFKIEKEENQYTSSNFEQGGILFNTGKLYDDTTSRIRTKDFIEVNPGDRIHDKIILKSSSTATVSFITYHFYNENKNWESATSRNRDIVPDRIKYIKIVIGNDEDGGTILPNDINAYYLMNSTELIKNYGTLTLFGSGNHDHLIGINSDDNYDGDILPPRALTIETFTDLQETGAHTGDIDYNLKLLLGDLSTLKLTGSEFNYINGYGLYADNVFLHGSLMTKGANNYAGVNTSKTIDFNYRDWVSGTRQGVSYEDEKIIFWGGANSLNEIGKSPFIVTDKGSIFASRGEFKGAVIADSVITDAIIKTPVIYGSGESPSLKIYNTNNSSGIAFYKLVGQIDKESNETDDIKTLIINTKGFYHYTTSDQSTGLNFIEFNETSNNIYFTGTQLTTGTTTFSSRSIIDWDGNSGDAAAEITLSGFNGNTAGEIQIGYGIKKIDNNITGGHGIQISGNDIWNFGGKVRNDGEIIFSDENKQLDYKVNNGYYCLYVS